MTPHITRASTSETGTASDDPDATAGPIAHRPIAGGDRLLVALGTIAVLLALVTAVAGSVGLLSDAASVCIALVVAAAAVRIGMLLHARRVGPLRSARIRQRIALCLLGVSLLSVLVTYGLAASRSADPGIAIDNLLRQAATVIALILLSLPARTLGWQPVAGAALVGFLAVPALARVIGVPIVESLGVDSLLATAFWVPLTEEALKTLPVLVLVLVAVRSRTARPAAVDIAVVGAASGAGFSLLEDLQYGRSLGESGSLPPLSWVFPTIDEVHGYGGTQIAAGHAIWTALIALGLGITVLYRRRTRLAWAALPVAFVIVVAEHALLNAGSDGAGWMLVVAGGRLSPWLLALGFVAMSVCESRPLRGADGIVAGLLLRQPGLERHRRALAARQRAGVRR